MTKPPSKQVVITGSGIYHPSEGVTNEELVTAYNAYVDLNFNLESNKPKKLSAQYIKSISGIKHRYVRDKKNILDPKKMWPNIAERSDNQISMQAEACVKAAIKALKQANKTAEAIDAVIVSCAHKQRDFPSIAIETQAALGIEGYAYDMNSACSSAVFGIHSAYAEIMAGSANSILLICPEIKSGQFSYTDPSTNFIFGEATAAIIIENMESCTASNAFAIRDIVLHTTFSNNIRNNRGAYNRCAPEHRDARDKLFYQNGRLVFKDLAHLAPKIINKQLERLNINKHVIKRFWLHQANAKLNKLILKNLLNKDIDHDLAPIILDEFANVSSAGALVCFDRYRNNLTDGDYCILSAFGAGYTIGSILLQHIEEIAK